MSMKHRALFPHWTKGGATFFESGGYILRAKRAEIFLYTPTFWYLWYNCKLQNEKTVTRNIEKTVASYISSYFKWVCPTASKRTNSFISSWTSILSTTSLCTWHCDEV